MYNNTKQTAYVGSLVTILILHGALWVLSWNTNKNPNKDEQSRTINYGGGGWRAHRSKRRCYEQEHPRWALISNVRHVHSRVSGSLQLCVRLLRVDYDLQLPYMTMWSNMGHVHCPVLCELSPYVQCYNCCWTTVSWSQSVIWGMSAHKRGSLPHHWELDVKHDFCKFVSAVVDERKLKQMSNIWDISFLLSRCQCKTMCFSRP